MINNNLKIVLDNGQELDYTNPESLGIKFNRIADDFQQPDKRFFDYTYTVQFPKTKNNSLVFEFPDSHGRTYIFNGKSFGVQVFNNNQLLIKGIITLLSFDKDSYNCQITSNIKELTDSLKGKKLVDITSLDIIPWAYEKTIAQHINANYTFNQTSYQFPLSMYKTFACSGLTSGSTEQQFSYIYNYDTAAYPRPVNGRNYLYQLHFPPAIYLYNIMQALFKDAGWALGGTFLETQDFRKIIIPYCGKTEDYSGAISSGTTTTLNLNKILPDSDQTEFLKSMIMAFNLYLIIDPDNKVVTIETYNTLFNDFTAAYDISDKIDSSSIKQEYPNSDVKISFDISKGNSLVAGYNRLPDYVDMFYGTQKEDKNPTYNINVNNVLRTELANGFGYNRLTNNYKSNAYENLYNKVTGDKEVKLKFSAANYVSMTLRNTLSKTQTNVWDTGGPSAGYHHWLPLFTISIPLLSDQTPFDNKDNVFASDSGDTYTELNDHGNISYDNAGDLKMYYYYNNFAYDTITTGRTYHGRVYKDWVYLRIATGGTSTVPTYCEVNVPIASPFKLMSTPEQAFLLSKIKNEYLDLTTHYPTSKAYSEIGAEAQGLLQTYFSVGTTGNTHTPTSYSLTMGDNSDFVEDNLYSYFHRRKYELYKNSSLLTADMRCTEIDWANMQIYTPILYNKEKYQLVSIKNYDPIKRTAEISMIKKI